ncbi:aminoglycoside phosphotransferase family protein [Streptomyces sp. NPDC050560]|uniref:aminoglycoside phosphotransferase family protein n=1 Tax=Streptomyces sp. NPDC050560 TaxID=3365630 RepID=UPI0037A469AB
MAFEPPPRLARALDEARWTGGEGLPGATSPADAGAQEHGDGAAWLAALPTLLPEAADRRNVAVERVHAPGGRSSVVALVRGADGSPAVLKLAPDAARPGDERAALAHWAGVGAVRLLDSADGGDVAGDGAMLLERLRPDVSLRSLPESRSVLEAAETVRRLWVAPPAHSVFETVTERTERQAAAMRAALAVDGVRDVPGADALADAALEAHAWLTATSPAQRLLHGTFRQSKVLAADRVPWLAVGPDPVVGECAFDLARLVRDRAEDLIASPSGASVARRRVRRLAESLELDAERVRGWTLFRAVESALRALRTGRSQDGELLLEYAAWL